MPDKETAASREEIAEIMRQLKEEVRHRRRELDSTAMTPGAESPGLAWPAALDQVHAAARVNPHLPIAWPTWPRGLWPKIVALAQKTVRRLLRWYINPIVEQQNRFNAASVQAIDLLWHEFSRLQTPSPQEEAGNEQEGQ